jgi:hypothetical protein
MQKLQMPVMNFGFQNVNLGPPSFNLQENIQ